MTPEDSSADGDPRVRCWACAELVHPDARKCRWCGEWYGELAQRSIPSGPLVNAGNVQDAIDTHPDHVVLDSTGYLTEHEEIAERMLRTDAIALEIGDALVPVVDPEQGDAEFLERLKHVRRRLAMEFGVIAPGIRVRPNPTLEPGGYRIRIRGDLVAEGVVRIGETLALGRNLEEAKLEGDRVTDPVFGSAAQWISTADVEVAMRHALETFDPQDVIASHVAEMTKQHLAELLTREEVAELLNLARRDSPMVVQELVPNMLALGQLRQVLQNLVKEQVSIKDLSTILNALADNAVYTKDPHALTEHVRAALGRKICARYLTPEGTLKAFMLSPDAERAIQNAIQLNETGQVLMLDPNTSQAIQNNLADALNAHRGEMLDPIVITPPKIRRHVKNLLERNFRNIVVLSYSEIVAGVRIDNLATIEAHMPGRAASSSVPTAEAPAVQITAGSDWLMTDMTPPPEPPPPPTEKASPEATDWHG